VYEKLGEDQKAIADYNQSIILNPKFALAYSQRSIVRQSLGDKKARSLIEKSFQEAAKKMDFQVIEFNGEGNHVHSLIEYSPKLSVSQIVNALKGVSSRRYGQAGYKKPHKEALWSPSYFAISVGGAPLEILKEYIKNQEKPSLVGRGLYPLFRSKEFSELNT
jgi:putative transposase